MLNSTMKTLPIPLVRVAKKHNLALPLGMIILLLLLLVIFLSEGKGIEAEDTWHGNTLRQMEVAGGFHPAEPLPQENATGAASLPDTDLSKPEPAFSAHPLGSLEAAGLPALSPESRFVIDELELLDTDYERTYSEEAEKLATSMNCEVYLVTREVEGAADLEKTGQDLLQQYCRGLNGAVLLFTQKPELYKIFYSDKLQAQLADRRRDEMEAKSALIAMTLPLSASRISLFSITFIQYLSQLHLSESAAHDAATHETLSAAPALTRPSLPSPLQIGFLACVIIGISVWLRANSKKGSINALRPPAINLQKLLKTNENQGRAEHNPNTFNQRDFNEAQSALQQPNRSAIPEQASRLPIHRAGEPSVPALNGKGSAPALNGKGSEKRLTIQLAPQKMRLPSRGTLGKELFSSLVPGRVNSNEQIGGGHSGKRRGNRRFISFAPAAFSLKEKADFALDKGNPLHPTYQFVGQKRLGAQFGGGEMAVIDFRCPQEKTA